ncbi:zinc knuckle protein [Apiospora marii]|uniref:zinc knuckle protein n=1 Tax=Apiospora marii TaxID=335849 RepID=UPI0031305276
MGDWNSPSDHYGGGQSGGFDDNFGGDQFGSNQANGFDGGDQGFGATDGGGGGGGACYNCGQEGHNKADCPEPRVIRCRHCNEEGHYISQCPDPTCPPQEPREFTGECRSCGQQGHRAADCPDRGPMVCNNCQQEGHAVVDCKNARVVNRDDVKDVSAEAAWEMIVEGANIRDLDDVKEGVQCYVKSTPEITYQDLETAFRNQDMGVYLIAVEKPAMLGSLTNMDFQGNLDKKYQVTYRFDARAARPREAALWPKDAEENMARLADAGEPVNRGLTKCNNCEKYGHMAKHCPDDKIEKERVKIICFNCEQEGHRVRDCPTPRVDKFACKNCGKPGHKVADCPEPPNLDNVECRKCGENGHFSRDCPQGGGGGGGCHNCGQEGHRARDCTEEKKIICRNCDGEGHTSRECPEPKNMEKVQCRNCDEFGHESRGCPKPRDMSRVKCSNCGEMGHFKSRCTNPTVDPNSSMDPSGFGSADAGFGSADAGFGSADSGFGSADQGFASQGDTNGSAGFGGDWQSSGGGTAW